MRRAQQLRIAPRHVTSTAPQAGPLGIVVVEPEEFMEVTSSTADPPVKEVLLSPAGTFVGGVATKQDVRIEGRRDLAIAIRQRIESRLHGRVRNLVVRILDDTVVLEGQCSTYYTKQLAQHAALGVLEHEHLENAIAVCVPG
jgi:hypothetical protein